MSTVVSEVVTGQVEMSGELMMVTLARSSASAEAGPTVPV
jgi:hypothetical protein